MRKVGTDPKNGGEGLFIIYGRHFGGYLGTDLHTTSLRVEPETSGKFFQMTANEQRSIAGYNQPDRETYWQ